MPITLREAEELLKNAGVSEYALDARILFRHYGSFKPYEIIEKNASSDSRELADAIKRRQQREPLAYIIGECDFYREHYKLSRDCLIPRQDTELLVDFAVKSIPDGESFIDLCTGSGCVAISTLANTKNTRALAVDISAGALKVARENAAINGVAQRFTAALSDAKCFVPDKEVFALLSNPPYVSENEYEELEEELYREPKIAFIGGSDGLDFYRSIIPNFKDKINPLGFMAFEIGARQADGVRAIAEDNALEASIIKDYSGLDRVAVLRPRK